MLGLGGGQLYTPILFWLGMDFKTEVIPLSLALNLVTTSSASITYGLKKLMDWKVALPFGVTMAIFAPFGTWLNLHLPTKPIIITFAVFAAAAAVLMLSGYKPKSNEITAKRRNVLGLSGGSGIGFLTGLTGLGGGAFVMPILYSSGMDAKFAATASAFAATSGGISGFISHMLTAAEPQWSIWIANMVAVAVGSQIGSRLMVAKLKSKNIKMLFGFVLLLVAVILLVQNFL